MPETLSEPFKSVLLPGTKANYDYYPDQSVFTPDTSVTTAMPGLLVYRDETAANGVELCDANYGDGIAITAASENIIGIIEIPKSHPSFPKQYDKATAFTAATDYFQVHWLKPGDRIWAKGSSLTATIKQYVICDAGGLVAPTGGTGTIDKYGVHAFQPLIAVSSATWIQVEYVGRIYGVDDA
jgi:hypothetical protein